MIEVGFARKGEADAAAFLLRSAAEWLVAKGAPLWPPSEFTAEAMARLAVAGELACGRAGGEPIGVFLLQLEDPQFWPDRRAGEAAYLHKLAVRRDWAGRGFPSAAVDWAKVQATRHGRRYLRLDCAPVPKLCAVYEALGFRFVDVRRVEPFVVRRYEMLV